MPDRAMPQYNGAFEARVEARLTVVEQVLMRIEQRLFGNGQPGELTVIKTRLAAVEKFQTVAEGQLDELPDLHRRLDEAEDQQDAAKVKEQTQEQQADKFFNRLAPFVPWLGWLVLLAAMGYAYLFHGGKLPG